MRRILSLVAGLLLLAACQSKPQEPGYIVQVSLGGWNAPDYTAEQVIGRIQEVNALIPVRKVIIGWSLDKQVYRQVGEYLHANGIKMLLWLPVFAETEEMCDNEPAVDLAGEIPAARQGRRRPRTWSPSMTTTFKIAASTAYSWTGSVRSLS